MFDMFDISTTTDDEIVVMMSIFPCFCYHLLTFSLIFCFSKNSFKNNIRVSNCLDPDQDGHSFLKP